MPVLNILSAAIAFAFISRYAAVRRSLFAAVFRSARCNKVVQRERRVPGTFVAAIGAWARNTQLSAKSSNITTTRARRLFDHFRHNCFCCGGDLCSNCRGISASIGSEKVIFSVRGREEGDQSRDFLPSLLPSAVASRARPTRVLCRASCAFGRSDRGGANER